MEQQLTVEQLQQIWKVIDSVGKMEEKLGEVYLAIVGNQKMGQDGIIDRMDNYEKDTIELRQELIKTNKRLDKTEQRQEKNENFVKGAMWAIGIAGAILGFFTNAILKLI